MFSIQLKKTFPPKPTRLIFVPLASIVLSSRIAMTNLCFPFQYLFVTLVAVLKNGGSKVVQKTKRIHFDTGKYGPNGGRVREHPTTTPYRDNRPRHLPCGKEGGEWCVGAITNISQ